MGIGTVLKDILSSKNISIKQLAEMTDIPVNTLYSITGRDSKNLRSDTLQKITEALNLNTVEIFQLTNPGLVEETRKLIADNIEQEKILTQQQLSEISANFEKLNIKGKIEAAKRVEELTFIEKYQKGKLFLEDE